MSLTQHLSAQLPAHLPALQVVLPLLSAPLAVLLRHGGFAFAIVTAAAWAAFATAIGLWLQVGQLEPGGVISYHIGSWAPPWGIEYRVDRLASFVLLLVSGTAAVVLPWSRASIAREIPPERHYLFYAMFGLCLTGLLGITITGDAFNIFVFLEISSLSTYVLIALGQDRRALAAAYRYLIMGSIGATFIVIGIGFLYLMTGTLNLADMAVRLRAMESSRPVLAALAFLTVGISLKLALFPLHQWLPNAYTYAPSAVTAFLAATATKVSVYVLIRFYFSVFGESLVFHELPLPQIMLWLSLFAMFAASFIAIFQDNLKRLFAYSSVGQIGYITLGLSFDSVHGLTASIIHLFNHGITKGAIFLLIGGIVAVSAVRGAPSMSTTVTFARIAGLGKRMPLTCFGIVIAGLSLIGVPGTAGFISKWYLIVAALEAEQYWLVGAILLSSLLAVAYVWRFVEAAYFRPPPAGHESRNEASLALLIPAWVLVAATLWFGLDTSFTVGSALEAAQQLVRSGQ
ncbi:MAG: monovalent cation/H+ antiporter subunit D family protein [Pseudomonadota bacterium]|nr:monovalent cation/H+ antiporter subunit D family protein [Pseudomonadota bacterium]MDP1906423.1 monovalent cation/H+ antiporter subunit D family protein [Pseudomonadota bacterium]MDP2351442.1 monovalent cation/H+ antiporter subunit D family protein [Pseudomonadota bacterium]